MGIKYAEITIIRDLENESYSNYLKRLIGFEPYIENDNSQIIILFDDKNICDVKNEYIVKNIEFSASINSILPHFIKISKTDRIIFYKNPETNFEGKLRLNFNNIFKNYNNFNSYKRIPSYFNCIYEIIGHGEIFAICKIQSNEEKPRYILAYDEYYFDRSDIIYLIYSIFNNSYNKIIKI